MMSRSRLRSPIAPALTMPVLLTQGFRPFFLATGLWAVIAIALWIGLVTTGGSLPSRFDPVSWHSHEMIFGFGLAAIAGFLLTAIPNWTKRLPVSGVQLALLAGLWLLGRVACLTSALFPTWLSICADLAFPVLLVAVIAREIIAGQNWHNLPMVAPVTVLTIANLLMHLEAAGLDVPQGLGWRLGLAAIVILISVVAGRILPSFTRNWLMKHGAANLPAVPGPVDRAALGVLHAGLISWAVFPATRPVGYVLLAAAALNLWRLIRWRGGAIVAEPMLMVLHLGYLWLVLGAGLLGLSLLSAAVPISAAIHALTVGAIGTMILAVMTRATRGHTGRELRADPATSALYVLLMLATLLRIGAAFATTWATELLEAAAGCWIAAFLGFVVTYGFMLLLPRRGRS